MIDEKTAFVAVFLYRLRSGLSFLWHFSGVDYQRA
jgi:hypothetical protein